MNHKIINHKIINHKIIIAFQIIIDHKITIEHDFY